MPKKIANKRANAPRKTIEDSYRRKAPTNMVESATSFDSKTSDFDHEVIKNVIAPRLRKKKPLKSDTCVFSRIRSIDRRQPKEEDVLQSFTLSHSSKNETITSKSIHIVNLLDVFDSVQKFSPESEFESHTSAEKKRKTSDLLTVNERKSEPKSRKIICDGEVLAPIYVSSNSATTSNGRKGISPFYRKPSPMLKTLQDLILREEEALGSDEKYSSEIYNELSERIHDLEHLVGKHHAHIAAEVDKFKVRIRAEPRDDLHVIQASSEAWDEEFSENHIYRGICVEKEDKHYLMVYGFHTILGIIIVVLVYLWVYENYGGFSLDNPNTEKSWHVLLSVIGFLFLNCQAMLIFRTSNHILKGITDRMKSIVNVAHLGIQIIALILGAFSIKAIDDSQKLSNPPRPTFYTLHSWIGIIAFVIFIIQILSGFLFIIPKMSSKVSSMLMPVHVHTASTIMIMMIASCLLGFMKKASWIFDSTYQEGGCLVNSIGLLMVIYGGISIYLLQEQINL